MLLEGLVKYLQEDEEDLKAKNLAKAEHLSKLGCDCSDDETIKAMRRR